MIQPAYDRHKPETRRRELGIAQTRTFRKLVRKHRDESVKSKRGCSLVVLEFSRSVPDRDTKAVAAEILRTAGGKRVEVGVLGHDHLGLLLPGVAGTRASQIADTVCRELALVMRKPSYDVYALPPPELARSIRDRVLRPNRRFTRYSPTPTSATPALTLRPPAARGPALSRAWASAWTDLLDGAAGAPLVPAWKRVLDLAGAIAALVLLAPVMAVIALGIKVVSPGPILFQQERVGLKGSRFMCLKFRSMHQDADTDVHKDYLNHLMHSEQKMTKLDKGQDSRLIPFAAILRATGLDELPQLINVLLGDMSLVGPRPCTVYEYDSYQPWHISRFDTLPGLTGLWQVSGKNRLTFNEMMHLDISYAQAKTLWMDLQIIALTPYAIVQQVIDCQRKIE